MKLKLAVKKEPGRGDFSDNRAGVKVLKKAQTRFGLLEVTKDGANFPDRGVHFSNQELSFVMGKDLSRQMIDGILRLKEVFGGKVV